MSRPEVLGRITVPSGVIVAIDMGLLALWSHDRPPLVPEGAFEPDLRERANGAVDLRIAGPDWARAVRAFDRQTWSHFICDVPSSDVAAMRAAFDDVVKKNALDARLEVLAERVSHRARVDATLALAPAGIVQFHGIWATTASGLPTDRALGVLGERVGGRSEWAECWRAVWVEVTGSVVARSERAGDVMVDRARLAFADADALGAWRHEEPIDGRADFVFWGRDAAAAARAASAPSLGDGEFGWRDLPVEEAAERGTGVEELRRERSLRIATDFRPHSHQFYVLDQIRSTPSESGTLEVGGAVLCGFTTTWGDGCFPVFRDLDSSGALARLRVELAPERY